MSCNPFLPKACEWIDAFNRPLISKSDRGNAYPKYTAKNNGLKQFNLFKVDGHLITEGNKCDYLLLGCDDKTARYIELKGSDLEHAALQIATSIRELSSIMVNYTPLARIVMNKTPATGVRGAEYRKLSTLVKGEIVVRTRQLDENI